MKQNPKTLAGAGTIVIADRQNKITPQNALDTANKKRVTLFSNRVIDEGLQKGEWSTFRDVWPVITGTWFATVGLGKSFKQANRQDNGNWVVYQEGENTYRFPVLTDSDLARFDLSRESLNVFLFIEHGVDASGKTTLEMGPDGDKNTIIVSPAHESIVAVQIPDQITWRLADKQIGVPVLNPASKKDEGARMFQFYGEPGDAFIGPVVRGDLVGVFPKILQVGHKLYEGFGAIARNSVGENK